MCHFLEVQSFPVYWKKKLFTPSKYPYLDYHISIYYGTGSWHAFQVKRRRSWLWKSRGNTHHGKKSVNGCYSLLRRNIRHILWYYLVCYSFRVLFTELHDSLLQINYIYSFLLDNHVCYRHLGFFLTSLVATRWNGLVTVWFPRWRRRCTHDVFLFA